MANNLMLPVHMLWVSGPLSRLARLALASFVANGFEVTLWTYDRPAVVDCGVQLGDAAEFSPREGSITVLSSLIRYKLLAVKGGLWSDMDIVALTTAPALPVGPFVASEKRRPFRHREASATGESLTQVTNCFMANPLPSSADLWRRATRAVETVMPHDRTWENSGPHLLTRLMLEHPDDGVAILPPETVNAVAWWNVPVYFLEDREPPPTPFVHLYASIWAKRGINEELPFPTTSLAGRLWTSYGL